MFRATDPATLRRVSLDGLIAIYDRRSGQTHLLAEPSPEILDIIGDGAGDVAAVAARMGVPDAADIVAERIEELVSTGLIEVA